jgi:hypothetical protein
MDPMSTASHNDLFDPDLDARLRALQALAAAEPRPEAVGTNTHVHTNYSFSAFTNPCEAAWLARQAGVEVIGINDHYTVDGHPEFRAACQALHLPATFSIESVAMDRDAEAAGMLLNDPGNPGRTYLCGKGVTTPDDPAATAMLRTLRGHQERRNKALVVKVAERFESILGRPGPTWDDVIGQTPKGNTTERHLARAIVRSLEVGEDYTGDFTKLVGTDPSGDAAKDQNAVRSALLKAGKPCYVDEDPEAYPSVEALRALYLQLGAIPTYPVLGNPETGGEASIAKLCDHLAAKGIFALELIPTRNTDDRVAETLAAAAERGWPVFDGTEHNTPVMEPLTTTWGSDPRFRNTLRDGALVLLGHQALCAAGGAGYVDRSGAQVDGGLERCRDAGAEVLRTTLAG